MIRPPVSDLGVSWWGPLFPDAAGATYTVPAVAAELALGNPLTSFGGALENAKIRALVAGADGNDITIRFVDDSLSDTGDLNEDTGAKTVVVHFVGGATTVSDIYHLLAVGSELVELVGTWNPGDLLASDDDEFSPTHLADGADETGGVPARYWGPLFPDAADSEAALDFIPGNGPAGVATFALLLEGATANYGWATDVFKSYSGKEQRRGLLDDPRLGLAGTAHLVGDRSLAARNDLQRYASLGSEFMIALPYEEATIAGPAEGDGRFVRVYDASLLDWANPGQRVIVVDDDDDEDEATTVDAVVQSVVDDVIELDVSALGTAREGGRIVPLVAAFLDARQAFARYPNPETAVERWALSARAATFGFTVAATPAELALGNPLQVFGGALEDAKIIARTRGAAGNGITVEFSADSLSETGELEEDAVARTVLVKFVDGATTVENIRDLLAAGSALVRLVGDPDLDLDGVLLDGDDEFPPTPLAGGEDESAAEVGRGATLAAFGARVIYDRGVDVDTTADDSLQAMNEIVDLGGVPIGVGTATVPDWGRQIAIGRTSRIEFQWLKRFLDAVKGRWKTFYLPTFRNDLLAMTDSPDGGTEGDITIDLTHGDFNLWADTHDLLQLELEDGTEVYCEITDANDNDDGTMALTLQVDTDDPENSFPASQPIVRISWLELCRLEKDDVEIEFKAAGFEFKSSARVVQQ